MEGGVGGRCVLRQYLRYLSVLKTRPICPWRASGTRSDSHRWSYGFSAQFWRMPWTITAFVSTRASVQCRKKVEATAPQQGVPGVSIEWRTPVLLVDTEVPAV